MEPHTFTELLDDLIEHYKYWRDARTDWPKYEAKGEKMRNALIEAYMLSEPQTEERK